MKTMIRTITKIAPLLLSLLTCPASFAQNTDPGISDIVELDRIVAVVNDDVLMESELTVRMREVSRDLRAKGIPPPPASILQKQVLERLMLQRLQLQEARNSGVRIEDQALNRTIQKIAEGNNLTLKQFRRVLERDGFSFAQFRENVRNEIMIGRVRSRKVKNRIKVSDQEIEHLLENLDNRGGLSNQYRLGHILIAIPDGASTSAIQQYRAKAEKVVAELKSGADFRQAAAANSDSQTALEGGDLGWRKRSELPSVFEDIVPTMDVGQVSDIIRTPGGFHIIKLMDRQGGDQVMVTQTLVRHILIKPSAIVSESDARSRIEHIRNRVASGEDFALLAKSNSDDTASAVEGGSLGWTTPGQMAPEFEDAMNNTRIGEVSPAFLSPFGWHILKVEDRRKYDGTLEFRRNKAREIITKRKMEEELELWLRRLRDEAYTDIRLNENT
ncbi:MAG: peptidylprolyl isomerase [Gammaproteobacteria bacterium]|nr:peptidylprolyl isomerase [Gammaproteobacteria bacterium]